MSDEINFDTAYTLLYKKSYELSIPVSYIIYDAVKDSYITFFDIFNYSVNESLYDLYLKYQEKKTFKEFISIYIYYALRKRIQPDILLETINNTIKIYNEQHQELNINFPEYDKTSLKNAYSTQDKEYKNELIQDRLKYEEIVKVQDILQNTEPLEIVNFLPEESSFEITPEILIKDDKNRKRKLTPNIEAGIVIFEEVKATSSIPFIRYNSYNGNKYFKIYDSETFKDLESIININAYDDKPNIFYFLVLNTNEYQTTKRNAYTEVVYYLETNKIKFSCKDDEENTVFEKIINRLQDSFYGFEFVENSVKKYNMKASFKIPDFNFDIPSFHFILTNDVGDEAIDSIKTYFFIDETELCISERRNPEIKFKSLDEEDEDEIIVSNPSSGTISLEMDKKDTTISIKKAANEDTLIQIINILPRILNIYSEYEPQIADYINDIVPDKVKSKKRKQEKYERPIDQLRAYSPDPDIFNPGDKGYARICEKKKQPKIVSSEEAEKWIQNTFDFQGETLNKQVAQFPPPPKDPLFLYICPNEEFPFPSVAKNNDPSNLDKYPYIPCCGKSDQITKPNSNYNTYYNVETKDVVNHSYKINTFKHLPWGRTGEIPVTIQNLMNIGLESKYKYERFGTGKTTNSLLHCLFKSTNEENYINMNEKEREAYCNKFRTDIPKLLENYITVCKQETYDLTKESIDNILKDNKRNFLDSSSLYHLFEELFDVNIFILYPYDVESDNKNEKVMFEIPKHCLTHIRTVNLERKTVVLLKHYGGEMETLEYPVYDIIFNTGITIDKNMEINERQFTYDFNITNKLFEAYQSFYLSFSVNYNSSKNKFEARENPYIHIDWYDVFKDVDIVSQYIDVYGKTRRLNVSIPNTDIKISIFVPPTQPLNIPEMNTIYTSDEATIRKIFGEPTKAIVNGLWYKVIDYDYGIFIPCPTNSKEKCPESPVTENNNIMNNDVFVYRDIKKYSQMLIKVIIWTLRTNGIKNLKDYNQNKDKFLIEDNNVRPNIYPNKQISYISMKDFSSIWPEYFRSDKTVHLYSSLYNKIIEYLDRYYTITDGLSKPADPYLTGIFEYEWDFTPYPNNRILIGKNHLDSWLLNHKNNYKGEYQYDTQLNPDKIVTSIDPFVYYDSKLNIRYLVQNVSEGSLQRALNCGLVWYQKKMNLGYDCPRINKDEELTIPYIIYNISSLDSNLYLSSSLDNKTNGSDDYITVVKYGNRYAALLELF